MDQTILWQRAEGAIIFVAAILVFIHGNTELPWWIAVPIFFAPDLSFAGYLLGPKVGAFGYNTVHVYAFGMSCCGPGLIATDTDGAWSALAGTRRVRSNAWLWPEDARGIFLHPFGSDRKSGWLTS